MPYYILRFSQSPSILAFPLSSLFFSLKPRVGCFVQLALPCRGSTRSSSATRAHWNVPDKKGRRWTSSINFWSEPNSFKNKMYAGFFYKKSHDTLKICIKFPLFQIKIPFEISLYPNLTHAIYTYPTPPIFPGHSTMFESRNYCQ